MIRIRQAIYDRMEELTPSERKVARTLLADYPSVGLGSTTTLAKAAGTSAPTVLRLVSRLGISSYTDFQMHLRDEIMHDLKSPVRRAEHEVAHDGETDFARSVAERRALVDRLESTVATAELERAAQLLAGEPRAVLIAGGYYSRFIAEIMARQLDQIIPRVDFLADPLGYDVGKFYGARKNTVVVLFDLRRYQGYASSVAALAKREGASLIIVTDEELSPTSDQADAVLAVPVGGVPFDSFAALMVLTEALVEAVFRLAGPKAIERMRLWEERSYLDRAPQTGSTETQEES